MTVSEEAGARGAYDPHHDAGRRPGLRERSLARYRGEEACSNSAMAIEIGRPRPRPRLRAKIERDREY